MRNGLLLDLICIGVCPSCGGGPSLPAPAPQRSPTDRPDPAHQPPPAPEQTPGATRAAAEDLRSSWRPDLAVAVPPLPHPAQCPDADGDGFPSAIACPAGDPAQLDCDDTDPTVTPATERWVRPGPFLMGSASSQAGADERPVHVVQLSGYCIDRTEVTVADFARWSAQTHRESKTPRSDMDGAMREASSATDRGRVPVIGVTWQEAHDYCAAHNKALPTEAQWEKAARGGCELGSDPARCDPADLRPYPWGIAPPDCQHANHRLTAGNHAQDCVGHPIAVDALPEGAGPYGNLGLAGNAWEYVADTWNPRTYGDGRERFDPGGPAGGSVHVLRGGAFDTFSTNMRVANRFNDLVAGSATGFRCARPTVKPRPDAVAALKTVTVSGTIHREGGLSGSHLYVTAFDAAEVDPRTGQVPPGRSPVAEMRLVPSGEPTQPFALSVPEGGRYRIFASLDAGPSTPGVPASGSGGVGEAKADVVANTDVNGVRIVLHPLPGAR